MKKLMKTSNRKNMVEAFADCTCQCACPSDYISVGLAYNLGWFANDNV